MPKLAKPLTDTQVKTAKPRVKTYTLADGGGMYLEIAPTGSKIPVVMTGAKKPARGGLLRKRAGSILLNSNYRTLYDYLTTVARSVVGGVVARLTAGAASPSLRITIMVVAG